MIRQPEIKGLVNKELWDRFVENNDDDPYGAAAVNVARNVMLHLDEHPDIEFNVGYHPDMTTPHGIICACDDQGGITDFQADCVRQAVTTVYKDGWKFFMAGALSPHSIMDPDRVHEVVEEVFKAIDDGTIAADKADVVAYSEDIVSRHVKRR